MVQTASRRITDAIAIFSRNRQQGILEPDRSKARINSLPRESAFEAATLLVKLAS